MIPCDCENLISLVLLDVTMCWLQVTVQLSRNRYLDNDLNPSECVSTILISPATIRICIVNGYYCHFLLSKSNLLEDKIYALWSSIAIRILQRFLTFAGNRSLELFIWLTPTVPLAKVVFLVSFKILKFLLHTQFSTRSTDYIRTIKRVN